MNPCSDIVCDASFADAETDVLHGRGVIPVPGTEQRPIADQYHGVPVTDHYQWLEDWADPAVRAWSDAQNAYARSVLDGTPGIQAIRARVTELRGANAASYRLVTWRAGQYFALKNEPPRQQHLLVSLSDPDNPATERVLIDPATLGPDGLTTIDWYAPSPDGKLVAVSLSEAGSERGSAHIYDVASGRHTGEVVPRVNYGTAGGSLAWAGDCSGFYYTRYPHPGERPGHELDFYVHVYFHSIGTPSGRDRYEIGNEFPDIAEPKIVASPDGRTLLVNVQNGDGGEFSQFLRTPNGTWTRLTTFTDRVVAGFFAPDGSLFLLSRDQAPQGKILRLELSTGRTPALSDATEVIRERKNAVIQFDHASPDMVVLTATRLYVVDQWGGPNHVSVFSHTGEPLGAVPLPPVTAVPEIVALPDEGLLIRSTSYLQADTWYRVVIPSARPVPLAISSRHPADFSDVEVVREVATSKDGTAIPLSILRRKGTALDGNNPALLYGYGGFGISQRPLFWPWMKIWLEQGGVFAVAHIRGGGEYGHDWHAAGSLTNKQNVFDDFIASAEHLIARRYTNRDRLALRGGSNGGLLVGAVLTQRPDLAKAVVAFVGLFDMLRSEREPNGVFNIPELGTVKHPDQFRALRAYSPYHSVKEGVTYPAVLMLTGANDSRVDPMNSRKMTARLQAASTDPDRVLLRTSASAGHGVGTTLSELIEQDVDVFTFLFSQLNVEYKKADGLRLKP